MRRTTFSRQSHPSALLRIFNWDGMESFYIWDQIDAPGFLLPYYTYRNLIDILCNSTLSLVSREGQDVSLFGRADSFQITNFTLSTLASLVRSFQASPEADILWAFLMVISLFLTFLCPNKKVKHFKLSNCAPTVRRMSLMADYDYRISR